MVKIYTKTGDKGETALFGGKRVSKADLRVEVYGCVDELNSVIGVVVAKTQISKLKSQNLDLKAILVEVQNDLMEIGSILANPGFKRSRLGQGATFMQKRIKEFEKLIDDLSIELPQLRNFILPGGGEVGSLLHFARTVCRRTERRIVGLSQKENVPENIIAYFNRLSDLLFVMARFVNHQEGKKEIIWRLRRTRERKFFIRA